MTRGQFKPSIGTLLSIPHTGGLLRRGVASRLGAPVARLRPAQEKLRADLTADPDPGRSGPKAVTGNLLWAPVVDGQTLPAKPPPAAFD
ncbi:hypothetical protein [Deinococcus planocerae]|uniref:hypothetical protein n=1 Tax=Deinococcus planocerae TaxID=1737569 RepID=UPI000C7F47F5|nr:hypothetical protein [Deinococcus planocerae]